MTLPPVRLAFFKLNVPDMAPALAFWRDAFGFKVTATFDEPEFVEHMMALPGQEAGPHLLLVMPRNDRDLSVGPGHGPVGLICEDVDATRRRALDSGATGMGEPFEAAGVRIALLKSPQGHEIELIQLP